MKQRIGVVLPWLDWDHFPGRVDAKVAHRVLSAWTAAWHPLLICQAEGIPEYVGPYQDLASISQQLLFVPEISELAQWKEGGSHAANIPSSLRQVLVQDDRRDAVATALRQSEHIPILPSDLHTQAQGKFDSAPKSDAGATDSSLSARYDDFMSLGYHYFQLQLLTRRMHGGATTSEATLVQETLRAARAWFRQDLEEMRSGLQGAFGALMNERSHYYPVDAYFLECVFWDSLTADQAVEQLQSCQVPTNWCLASMVLEGWIQDRHLEALQNAVQQRVAAKTLGLLGGESDVQEWTLLPVQRIAASIRKGREASQRILGKRPAIFARSQFGVSPRTPDVLKHFRYEGAVMSPLGMGRWPRSPQSRTQWVSLSQQTVEAVGTAPINPLDPAAMFHLAHSIAESMEKDYVATVLFASCQQHSHGTAAGIDASSQEARTEWIQDVKAGMEYGVVLGKFATVADYLQKASPMGQRCDLAFEAYISPYLRSDVRVGLSDPISRWTRFWQAHAKFVAASFYQGIASTLSSFEGKLSDGPPLHVTCESEFAERIVGATRSGPADKNPVRQGWLILNPFSSNLRRQTKLLDTTTAETSTVFPKSATRELPSSQGQSQRIPTNEVVHASTYGEACEVVVDVPACGYVWVPEGDAAPAKHQKVLPALVEGLELRNEFLRARIDRDSGGLASLHDFRHRSNRASQRLVWVYEADERATANASDDSASGIPMIAEQIEITRDDDVAASITSLGRLVSRSGVDWGRFRQEFTLSRGSRELWLRIRLDPKLAIHGDPFRNYVASRIAWRGESDRVLRWVQDAIVESSAPRFESPLFFQMRMGETQTTYFTPGLPYHVRPEPFRVDTLLHVSGETTREFVIGLGVDTRAPWQTALMQLAPATPIRSTMPTSPQGWFLQIDRRNVVVSYAYAAQNSEGEPTLRLQLAELDGLGCQTKLICWRPIRRACKVDAEGVDLASCEILDGSARFFMRPYEWTEVELHW